MVVTLILIMVVTLILIMVVTLFIIIMSPILIMVVTLILIIMSPILIMVVTLILIIMMLSLILIMVVTLILILMPATKGQRVEQIPHLQQVDPVCLCCLQHIDESLFQLDSIGHYEVGVVQKSNLRSRCPVVVRIGAHGEQHDQFSVSSHYVRDYVTQDRGGNHDHEA